MSDLQALYAICNEAAKAANAPAAGVAVTLEPSYPDVFFLIWSINVRGRVESHKLDCACTDLARLTAHVKGFAENHLASWAAFQKEAA